MSIICDTDILSSLAKIDRLELVQKVFPNKDRLIPPGVYEELEDAKEMGYGFPDIIFNFTTTITMDEDELEEYKLDLTELRKLDKGELQCIIIADNRDHIFLTNDKLARREGKAKGVKTYNLAEVVKAAYLDDELTTEEIKDIIQTLEEKDHFSFANESYLYD